MDLTIINERLQKIECLLSTQKEVMNIDELSLFTGLSKSSIYKKTHLGLIPFYRQAKHLFFDRVEILDWLKANKGFNSDEVSNQANRYVTLNKAGGSK